MPVLTIYFPIKLLCNSPRRNSCNLVLSSVEVFFFLEELTRNERASRRMFYLGSPMMFVTI